MAVRKPVVVNGNFKQVTGSNVNDVVPNQVSSITTGDGKLIERSDFSQTPIPEHFDTNIVEINKG